MGSNWGFYKTPCPQIVEGQECKGEVEYWFVSGETFGDQGSSGIKCKKCNKLFTQEEWGNRE